MNIRNIACGALSVLVWLAQPASASDPATDAHSIERGKYLARVGGCNDCHTPGYLQEAGNVSEDRWLTGSSVGFQGPWGTTYPANLRLYVQGLTESEWVERARQPMRPPMPWFNLKALTDDDLIALYRFIRHLGAAGEPAPRFAAPGEAVTTPFYDFVPKNLPQVVKR